jgi:omega-6 fatty acid desaturase (delta-12 desaturase)
MPTASSKEFSKQLIKATRPFAQEQPTTTWVLFAITVTAFTLTHVAIRLSPYWWLSTLLSVVAALIMVRIFIFYHDHVHNAIWVRDRLGQACMTAFGFLFLTPRPVWRETHDYHHQNNAKLLGSAIGSFPVITTRMWAVITPNQRRQYAFIRHPINIALGYLTTFCIGMCISPFLRNPKLHWQGPAALITHVGIIVGLGLTLGWSAPFFHVILPMTVTMAAGSYLFYAQHNFPDMELKGRRDWEYFYAALCSSSMMDMPAIMHWFTGNIGYHHIHHLSSMIPNYNLEQCHNSHEIFTRVEPVTLWKGFKSLNFRLWDEEERKLVSFRAIRKRERKPKAA